MLNTQHRPEFPVYPSETCVIPEIKAVKERKRINAGYNALRKSGPSKKKVQHRKDAAPYKMSSALGYNAADIVHCFHLAAIIAHCLLFAFFGGLIPFGKPVQRLFAQH